MSPSDCESRTSDVRLIGCCGAFCRTCRSFVLGSCKGCKLGYNEGQRSTTRAKCRIKVCCFGGMEHETCADCEEFDDCPTLANFYRDSGEAQKKFRERYREYLRYIRAHGYSEFIRKAVGWKRHYGDL